MMLVYYVPLNVSVFLYVNNGSAIGYSSDRITSRTSSLVTHWLRMRLN